MTSVLISPRKIQWQHRTSLTPYSKIGQSVGNQTHTFCVSSHPCSCQRPIPLPFLLLTLSALIFSMTLVPYLFSFKTTFLFLLCHSYNIIHPLKKNFFLNLLQNKSFSQALFPDVVITCLLLSPAVELPFPTSTKAALVKDSMLTNPAVTFNFFDLSEALH